MTTEQLLTDLCKEAEAYETDKWVVPAILEVEILTPDVIEPCAGLNHLVKPLLDANYNVRALDLFDWRQYFPADRFAIEYPPELINWFDFDEDLRGKTVFMNPPFSLACEFVDHARNLGARKIICFQRQAWRESGGRRKWWEDNPPSRKYVCGARATCWRFDIATECVGEELCGKGKGRGEGHVKCRRCMAGSPTAHEIYVWERGHRGAEISSAIYPEGKYEIEQTP